MDESQSTQPLPKDELDAAALTGAGDPTTEAAALTEADDPATEADGAVAAPPLVGAEAADDEPEDDEGVEVEIDQTLTRTQIIARLKAIVLELEGGSLVVGGIPVAELGDEVEFELEYCEKDGRRELEIELEW